MWTEESDPNPPESYVVLVPLVASECITFPSYIGLDLTPKLVWDATAGSPHGPKKKGTDEGLVYKRNFNRHAQNKGMLRKLNKWRPLYIHHCAVWWTLILSAMANI